MFSLFFGETSSALTGVDISRSSYQLMGHVGYDFGLGPITLRPSLGLGISRGNVEAEGSGTVAFARTSVSSSQFVLSPGAELLLGLGLWNVSAEARYQMLSGASGIILGLGVGSSI